MMERRKEYGSSSTQPLRRNTPRSNRLGNDFRYFGGERLCTSKAASHSGTGTPPFLITRSDWAYSTL
jgi:hypothetical protein